jgi:MFS family permease
MKYKRKIKQWLSIQPDWIFILYTSLVAFATYSCMYAFRKPFTVATFEGEYLWGMQLKIWFIAAQVAGYTISKFIGIKVVSEMPAGKRALGILALVAIAELSLFFFAWVPSPFRIIFLFTNGLPLGMIWGLVFAYLEGRKYTELLGAGLSVSFILASGFVKTVGKWLMLGFGISEYWMPFATGLLFAIPLIVFVSLLNQVPEPNMEDKDLRTERKPMGVKERMGFFREFATAIFVLILAYALLTIFREMRDNFAAEIWISLGYKDDPEIFTISEIPVGIVSLFILGMVTFIRNNMKALLTIIYLVIIGFILIAVSSFCFQKNCISGLIWMILTGMGLYLAYIPFNALLFERMIAAFRYSSNIGFVMYLADSFGYLSSIVSFSLKNFFTPSLSWLEFFVQSSYYIAATGIILMLVSAFWFCKKYQMSFTLNYKS